jgi:vanillate O-demethylase monooxygenase subunit
MFVRQAWYLAAWSNEIDGQPTQRWLLGEPVLFYRKGDGGVVAMDDRCPHRLVPLSMGKREGDDIRCIYHGALFSPEGKCLSIPGQSVGNARGARTYATVECWGGVWIWMGDAGTADAAKLPSAARLDSPGWRAIRGLLPCAADYELATDNLLDLSHEAYLHPHTIGTDEVAEIPVKIMVEGERVVVQRVMEDVPPPPLFIKARSKAANIDRYQTVTANLPSFITVDVKATDVGNPEDAGALEWIVMFFMTPERAGRTHYFFAVTRNFALGSDEVDQVLLTGSLETLREDIEMLEAQERMVADRPLASRTLFTRYDRAPERARAIVRKMVEREHAGRGVTARRLRPWFGVAMPAEGDRGGSKRPLTAHCREA